jgi:hypothetical protein
MTMHQYQVDQLYHPDRRSWPEGAVYQYRGGGHELLLFLESPTAAEIEDVRRGPVEFALLVVPPTIVFCYRFAGIPWSDSPYTIHLVPVEERLGVDDPVLEESRALLTVILVDAGDGVIRALRVISFSADFTDALRQAIREQAGAPWLRKAVYDQAIERIYRQYPSSERFVAAATARCRGGE